MRQCLDKVLPGAVFWLLGAAFLFGCDIGAASAQSTDQSYPTAVTGNELTGTIKARDIGDARLTSYYYTFNAQQGDLFINIVTKNLNGSVNLFAVDGLRQLGQVLVYADLSASETGRVIYFRQPEKVILRIQGRTPNDDPAEFQIKFAGSFEAAVPTDVPAAPTVSKAALETDSGIKVNSVGTIIAAVPKPKPTPAELPTRTEPEKSVAKTESEPPTEEPKPTETKPAENAETQIVPAEKTAEAEPKSEEAAKNPTNKENPTAEKETQISESKSTAANKRPTRRARNAPLPEPKKVEEPKAAKVGAEKGDRETTKASLPDANAETKETAKTEPNKAAPKRNPRVVVTENVPPPKPDPMASISLVILFKDGSRIDRPMNEVLRFSVDRGILTVVNKDGTTAKYSILDVTSVTIQNPY